MERQELFAYAKAQYGTAPDYPWKDWNAVLRHKENNKWYGLIMEVQKNRLGLEGDALVDVLNVKCDPLLIGSLRLRPGFHAAYHMSKDRWISIRLDGSVPADEIKRLLAMSYELTAPEKVKHQSHDKQAGHK